MFEAIEMKRRAVEAVATSTHAEQAFRVLREAILAGKFLPGQKMNIEKIRDEYGLGVTPVREALSRLSSIDLVVAEGQKGFRVAPVSLSNLLDITKTRTWIETIALRSSIAHADRDWEARVIADLHRLDGCEMEKGEPLKDDWYRANRQFHNTLVANCQSPQLLAIRSQLFDLSERYRRLSVVEGLGERDLGAEHHLIADAALKRDAGAAVLHVEEHFVETTLAILKAEQALSEPPHDIVKRLKADIQRGMPT